VSDGYDGMSREELKLCMFKAYQQIRRFCDTDQLTIANALLDL
jgi:hypothetical protein